MRAAVSATTRVAPPARNAAAAAASVAPVVVTSSMINTDAGTPARHQTRSDSPLRREQPGLRAIVAASQQRTRRAGESARHLLGQQLRVVEAALAPACGRGRCPGDDLGQRERRDDRHLRCQPRRDGVGAAVLHTCDQFARNTRVGEWRRPRVEARRGGRGRWLVQAGGTVGTHRVGVATASRAGEREHEGGETAQHAPDATKWV